MSVQTEFLVVEYPSLEDRDNGMNGVQIGLPATTYKAVRDRIRLVRPDHYLNYFDQYGNVYSLNDVEDHFGIPRAGLEDDFI